MKRALVFVFILACHPKAQPTADAGPSPISSASAGEDEEEEAILVQVADAGACPQRIHPDYCRFNCRTFNSRKVDKHARRIQHPERVAFGKCGALDVFAEDEEAGDAGVAKGIAEYFDQNGILVGAVDTRLQHCTKFGSVPECTPQLAWEESRAFTMTLGPVSSPSGLPQEVVARIVRASFGRFRACVETAKETRPVGRYAAKLVIAPSGSVSRVDDDGTTLTSHALSECLATTFRAISFPTPEGGPMTARVSLVFSR